MFCVDSISHNLAEFVYFTRCVWMRERDWGFSVWKIMSSVCLLPQSCPTLCDLMEHCLRGSPVHGDSPGKNTGVGCHALLQGILPTQVSCIAGRFFTSWATREAPCHLWIKKVLLLLFHLDGLCLCFLPNHSGWNFSMWTERGESSCPWLSGLRERFFSFSSQNVMLAVTWHLLCWDSFLLLVVCWMLLL